MSEQFAFGFGQYVCSLYSSCPSLPLFGTSFCHIGANKGLTSCRNVPKLSWLRKYMLPLLFIGTLLDYLLRIYLFDLIRRLHERKQTACPPNTLCIVSAFITIAFTIHGFCEGFNESAFVRTIISLDVSMLKISQLFLLTLSMLSSLPPWNMILAATHYTISHYRSRIFLFLERKSSESAETDSRESTRIAFNHEDGTGPNRKALGIQLTPISSRAPRGEDHLEGQSIENSVSDIV